VPSTDLPRIVTILGTNASGKSDLAVRLAEAFGAEVVSADSRQVYRGLDLGTGKLSREEMRGVPHHLIDVAEVGSAFSLAHYQAQAYAAIDAILARDKLPVLAGGTGLYLRAVVAGYELVAAPPDPAFRAALADTSTPDLFDRLRRLSPAAGARVEPNNRRRIVRALEVHQRGVDDRLMRRARPRYRALQLGMAWPRDVLYARIDRRLDERLRDGLVDEVRRLVDAGHTDAVIDDLGLEYRYVLRYLRGHYASAAELTTSLAAAIKQFSKRQVAWFKRDADVRWLDTTGDYVAEARDHVAQFMERRPV
jgi:tRNA dimethylallyltransferase